MDTVGEVADIIYHILHPVYAIKPVPKPVLSRKQTIPSTLKLWLWKIDTGTDYFCMTKMIVQVEDLVHHLAAIAVDSIVNWNKIPVKVNDVLQQVLNPVNVIMENCKMMLRHPHCSSRLHRKPSF